MKTEYPETQNQLKKGEPEMGTCCQLDCSDEDDKMLLEARERGVVVPEVFEQISPEVKEVKAQRCVECLKENIENAQNEIKERLEQENREPTDLERLDLRAEPTDKEYREAHRIGESIGMEGWEISNYPMVMGIKDPETLERIPDMEDRIKDEMTNLHNSKLSPRFRDAEVVDRIMLIDKDEPPKGTAGNVLKKGILVARSELSRVAHIFRDPDTGKLPEDQRMHWVAIHEICHLNMFKEKPGETSEFTKAFVDHYDEWVAACNAQLDGPGPVSRYAGDQLPKEGPRESGFLKPEFIAEHIAAWDTDLGVEISPKMEEFFDKYLT